jgi:hypothetical protein
VDCHLVLQAVRGVDDGFHFVEADGLRRVDAVEAPARAIDLDPIGSGFHAILDRLTPRIGVLRLPLTGRESLSRDEHPWADHRAHADQVAHRVVSVVRGTQVTNRRDSGFERSTGVLLREEDRDRRAAALAERSRTGLPVPVVGHVRVEIDQPGQAGEAPQVDGFCPGWHSSLASGDPHDPIAFDDDDGISDDACSVPQLAETDRLCLRCGGECEQKERSREGQRAHPASHLAF